MSCDARDTVGGGKSLVQLLPNQKLLIQAKVAKERQMGFKKKNPQKFQDTWGGPHEHKTIKWQSGRHGLQYTRQDQLTGQGETNQGH